MPVRPEELIVVGEVSRPHGVRGAVLVVPVTDFPARLLSLDEAAVVAGADAVVRRIEYARPQGHAVVMKFSGIDTPQAAGALRGATVEIPARRAVPLPPGEFYVFQVVGLLVRTPSGERVGEVVEVLRTGSNDVYVVRPPSGPEILLPAVDTYVQKVDLAAGEVVATLPRWCP